MKFKGINKAYEGRFITFYKAEYETKLGNQKIYEMVSRDGNIQGLENGIKNDKCDAVILIITSVDGKKILLNKEFRMAVGDFAYNFPAGLIDPGETPESTAVRELYEETGYRGRIDRIGTPSYSSPGLSGEQIIPVWMTIDRRQYPEPPESHPESTESIEVFPLYPDEIAPFLGAAIARGDGIDTKVLLLYRNGDHGI